MDPRWLALIVLTAARATMGFQFQSIASVSVPLTAAFGLSFGDARLVLAGLALMTLGGLWTGLADGFPGIAVGRLVAGTGAVLLNVAMTKMIAD
jgi:hypothetical protein